MKRFILILLCIFATPVLADTFTLDLGNTGGSFVGRMIQIFVVLTVLSLAPSIIMMVTSFTRLVVVFSFLRSAIGTQQSPPNMVLLGLAMFLSLFIMQPTFEQAYNNGISPLIQEKITEQEAFDKITTPFKNFMLKNVREKDLKLFIDLGRIENITKPEDTPVRVLVPAFIISELKRAFEIGFLIFIPFLVIDMVVASILMSMGMMMLPPVMIALPFKIIFFVLVDGWHLLCGSLLSSFKL
jgi:flagellar biosynthesis protein FliP